MTVRADIKGLQELQAANAKAAAAVRPSGGLGKAVQYATATAHRFAVQFTPVDTGAWRASHRMELAPGAKRGRVQVDPAARNPRSQARVRTYASVYEQRGGSSAPYARLMRDKKAEIQQQALALVAKELP